MNVLNKRVLQGVTLSLGSPLGWLLIDWVRGVMPLESIMNSPLLYSYFALGTAGAFGSFGWFLGKKEEYITKLAINDSLTGIFNLRYYKSRLEEEIARSSRNKAPISVITFDFDHFKSVNDRYGHVAGDKVLIELSAAAKACLRKHDVFARVGGEEFAILLPNSTAQEAFILSERIRKVFNKACVQVTENKGIVVTASFGISQYVPEESLDALRERVDRAMYQAKTSGRNRSVIYPS